MTTPDQPTSPPEWLAAPHPWGREPAPYASPGPSPLPTSAPTAGVTRDRAAVAATAVMAAVGLVAGIGIGSLVSRHGVRPTLSAVSRSQAPSLASPAAPSTDPGSAGPGVQNPGRVSPGSTTGNAAAQAIAAKVDPGIVDIDTTDSLAGGAGAGTGMILTASGEILTNNHVIDGATNITVTLVTTGKAYRAIVVGTDPTEDIAVLQLQGAKGLTPAPLASNAAVAVGDAVVAIGNAGGLGGAPSVVTGTVEAINQTITASDVGGANAETLNGLIQTNAPIQPGDSGGPLVDQSARVIGIDTAASVGRRFSAGAAQGFAIPIGHALSIAQQIESGQASATVHIGLPGFLGVSIAPASATSTVSGAVISAVIAGRPAASAGLHAGDVITAIDGQIVDSAKRLSALTHAHKPGDKVVVTWSDAAGTTHTASVTLATGPAD